MTTETEASEPNDVGADLDAAWEKASSEAEAAPEPTPKPEAPATVPEAPAEPQKGRARNPDGTFATKPAAASVDPPDPHSVTPPDQKPTALEPPAAAAVAPRTMPPDVREAWATTPKAVQEHLLKREGEVSRALTESAEARRTHQAFVEAITPYRAFMTGPPMQVVGGLLQTAAQLQTGSPQAKAAIVASIISGYGVSVEDLAAALDGKQQPQRQQGYQDPRLDQFLARQQEMENRREMERAQSILAPIAKLEFFENVRDTMAAMVDSAKSRGVEPNAQEIYDAACWAEPKVRAVLQQREVDKARGAQAANAARSRAAAVSVKTSPAPVPGAAPKGGKLEDDFEAVWAARP